MQNITILDQSIFSPKKKQFFLNAQILFLRAGFMTCWDVSAVFSPRIGDTKRQKN